MSKATTLQTSEKSARERILDTAADLFYNQGYKATGINEIIAKSGVAKATFYSHFPSKDDLCLAYVREAGHEDLKGLMACVASYKTPFDKYMAMVVSLDCFLKDSDFKGCRFLNMLPEVTDPESPIRKEGIKHYEAVRKIQEKLVKDLIASNPKKYRGLDAKKVTDDYMVIFTGAIALGEVYRDAKFNKSAIKQVKELVA